MGYRSEGSYGVAGKQKSNNIQVMAMSKKMSRSLAFKLLFFMDKDGVNANVQPFTVNALFVFFISVMLSLCLSPLLPLLVTI